MRALVVYESMFGNTHIIAEAIAAGLRDQFQVDVVSVDDATPSLLASADLLVVGGPTHAHGMTSEASRKNAVGMAEKHPELPHLDPAATDGGLRDWFHQLPAGEGRRAVAFDTRFHAAEMLTGAASHGIARRLRKHGYVLVDEPMSFFVDKATHLVPGEAGRATAWGASLAAAVAAPAR